jgi:hypothetical protein
VEPLAVMVGEVPHVNAPTDTLGVGHWAIPLWSEKRANMPITPDTSPLLRSPLCWNPRNPLKGTM